MASKIDSKFFFSFILLIILYVDFGFARHYLIFNDNRLPKFKNHAKVARKLVHKANWSAVGSLSTDKKIFGYPMVNMKSIADSPINGKSTGEIYFLLTDLDFTGQDWNNDNKVTFMFSEEQNGECSKKNIDPMEPICERAILSGQVVKIDINSVEHQAAWAAFVSRHPAAKKWIEAHNFYLCKLDIKHIYVIDFYGGAKDVSVEDYFKNNPENLISTEDQESKEILEIK